VAKGFSEPGLTKKSVGQTKVLDGKFVERTYGEWAVEKDGGKIGTELREPSGKVSFVSAAGSEGVYGKLEDGKVSGLTGSGKVDLGSGNYAKVEGGRTKSLGVKVGGKVIDIAFGADGKPVGFQPSPLPRELEKCLGPGGLASPGAATRRDSPGDSAPGRERTGPGSGEPARSPRESLDSLRRGGP